MIRAMNRNPQPDYTQLLRVLEHQVPDRPVLFEFFMNPTVYRLLSDPGSPILQSVPEGEDIAARLLMLDAFYRSGYDYGTVAPPVPFVFAPHETGNSRTYSLNSTGGITDRASFAAHSWPDPDSQDYSYLDILAERLPEGMALVAFGPGGVEENVIALTGYEQLCYMMVDDPELVTDIFAAVGSRLSRYYEIAAAHPAVCACISNDDWGFNTQTLLTRDQMQQWLYPWHIAIADTIHAAGKPAILHSCGNIYGEMEWIYGTCGYDAKHSFEDAIMPVEEAWERYHGKIALLGGIDVNYLIFESEENIYRRSRAMLERTAAAGSYALGTGNSVPEYIPPEKYLAMLKAAWDQGG